MTTAVGIDLGTTNSVIASWQGGEPGGMIKTCGSGRAYLPGNMILVSLDQVSVATLAGKVRPCSR